MRHYEVAIPQSTDLGELFDLKDIIINVYRIAVRVIIPKNK